MKLMELMNRRFLQVCAALTASMSFMSAGLGVSWTAPALPKLMSEDSHIPVSADESSWIVSFMSIGCTITVITLVYVTSAMGRKTILVLCAFPFIISWLVTIFATSVESLYVARFLCGMGVITSFVVAPMYLTEISEVGIRGLLCSIVQLSYNIGVLIEYSIGPYFTYNTVAIISAVFPSLYLSLMVWMPESPYFLLMKHKDSEAGKSLMRLRGKEDIQNVEEELSEMRKTVEESLNLEKAPVKDLIYKRGNRRALVLALGLVTLQQFCGQLAIVSYATQIFKSAASSVDENVSVIILGGIQTIPCVLLSCFVERFGRKPLLLLSSAVTTICTFVLGVYFYLENSVNVDLSSIDWIPITCLIIYESLFSLALGVVPFTVIGEIFPPNVKGLAASVALFIHSLSGIVVTKVFQIMTDDIGADAPFWLFFAYNFIGTLFIAWYLPETKGKSFAEIYAELEDESYPRKLKKVVEN